MSEPDDAGLSPADRAAEALTLTHHDMAALQLRLDTALRLRRRLLLRWPLLVGVGLAGSAALLHHTQDVPDGRSPNPHPVAASTHMPPTSTDGRAASPTSPAKSTPPRTLTATPKGATPPAVPHPNGVHVIDEFPPAWAAKDRRSHRPEGDEFLDHRPMDSSAPATPQTPPDVAGAIAVTPPTQERSRLRAELDALATASQALAAGDPATGLAHAEALRKDHPGGPLDVDAGLVAVRCLLALGQPGHAAQTITALRAHPHGAQKAALLDALAEEAAQASRETRAASTEEEEEEEGLGKAE